MVSQILSKLCRDSWSFVAWAETKTHRPMMFPVQSDCDMIAIPLTQHEPTQVLTKPTGMPPHTGQGSAMAFEDAATLADSITSSGGDDRLLRWQNHRVSRIEQVLAFTERSGAFRKGSSNLFAQITKEYVMWAALWWKSGSIGMDWLYGYDTRNLDRI